MGGSLAARANLPASRAARKALEGALGYATDVNGLLPNADDLVNDVKQSLEVLGFLTRWPDVLTAGAKRANLVANEVMARVRSAVGIR